MMGTLERALGRREWVWMTGADGAGDCERDGVDDDWGGPRDQADTFGIVGFLDVCAVEDLLILH